LAVSGQGGLRRGPGSGAGSLRAALGHKRRLSWLQALILLAVVSAGFVMLGAATVTRTDPERYPDLGTGLWWAVTTVTTVGYGDVVPATVAGRLVATGLMFVGIASFALLTAVAASAIVVSDVGEDEREIIREEGLILDQLRQLNERLARLERRTLSRENAASGHRPPAGRPR
jgi:voltage-gated potassium channel